jgi:hypothetical protein
MYMTQRTYTTDHGTTLRIPSGSIHRGTTPAGSNFTIVTKRDEYGRGSSHALWGIGKDGRRITLVRNVAPREVIPMIRMYEALGFTRINAGVEAF